MVLEMSNLCEKCDAVGCRSKTIFVEHEDRGRASVILLSGGSIADVIEALGCEKYQAEALKIELESQKSPTSCLIWDLLC